MTELKHQQTLIKWSQLPSVRAQWPELNLMYHIPNERRCSPATGQQLKLAGVRRGVPDIHLPVARGKYHSLYIEMKAEKGRLSTEQIWWREELTAQGCFSTVCYGFENARKVIEWYLTLPK